MVLNSYEKRKAIVLGAGGFVGGELLRLIVGHPHLDLAAALSATNAGRAIGEVYPNFATWTDASFADPSGFAWEGLESGAWTIFSALAHGEAMNELPVIISRLGDEANLIDLSGDFRIEDPDEYRRYYGREHAAPELLGRFVYGLPEMNRAKVREARLISNPGCLATGAQLAILPAAASRAPIEFIAIDGKTGSSGAGVRPKETTHHPNRMNNFRAYMQLDHQHTPEITAGWAKAGGAPGAQVSFVPHMAPMVRGIFTTAHMFSSEDMSADEVRGWYASYYSGSPFVRVVDGSPAVAEVWGTNRCDISVAAEGRRIVVCTAIDNLVKGAAGQAVQNANLMNGWDEAAGLLAPAPSPV